MKNINLICLCMAAMIGNLSAQENTKNTAIRKGQQVIKAYGNLNLFEGGATAAHLYYISNTLGIQTNLSVLFDVTEEIRNSDDYSSGNGLRFNPEIRYYPNRKKPNKHTSFFMGGGPIFKIYKAKEQSWRTIGSIMERERYQQFSYTSYQNISYGLMATLGIEGYVGKKKNFLFDLAYSFGLTQNHIRTGGDLYYQGHNNFDEILGVSNRKSGILPYIDLKVGFGYRFK